MAAPRWWLADFSYAWIGDLFILTATTGSPVFLTARYTTVEPQMHVVPRFRRGVALLDDLYPCFVAYNDRPQREPDDTFVHTFDFSDFEPGSVFYVYFWGSELGAISPSTSPWFKITVPARPIPSGWPYLGTWNKWPFFITNPRSGVLYLGLKNANNSKSCIYFSTDFGLNWNRFTDSLEVGFVTDVLSPTGAGYVTVQFFSSRIYFSVNGVNWAWWSPGGPVERTGDIYCPSGTSQRVWISGTNTSSNKRKGPWFSDNGGVTWVAQSPTRRNEFGRLRVSSTLGHGVMSHGIGDSEGGLYFSDDPAGSPADWAPSVGGVSSVRIGIEFPRVYSFSTPGSLIMWRSSDYGETFSGLNIPSGMDFTGDRTMDIAVSGGSVWCHSPLFNTPGLWYSQDGLGAWTHRAVPFGDDPLTSGCIHDVSVSGPLYAWGNLGGFQVSFDGGVSWELRNKGLERGEW